MGLTLPQFLNEDQRKIDGATGDFSGLVTDLAFASKTIASAVGRGALAGATRDLGKRLRAQAGDLLLEAVAATSHLAATLSPAGFRPAGGGRRGKYLLAFEPLVGAGDLDLNVQTGTIFSVLRSPDPDRRARVEDFLRPGRELVGAGLVQYGSSTRFLLATGLGVNGFTLDRDLGEYVLTHPDITVPAATSDVSLRAAGNRTWEPPVRRYVRECLEGAEGPRGHDFDVAWAASLVSETCRILTRGGVLLQPHDQTTRDGSGGHLDLLCEAVPAAWLVERAGGAAITGRRAILDIVPERPNQRVPLIFGSREEVDRLYTLHRNYIEGRDDSDVELPLFSTRSLFR